MPSWINKLVEVARNQSIVGQSIYQDRSRGRKSEETGMWLDHFRHWRIKWTLDPLCQDFSATSSSKVMIVLNNHDEVTQVYAYHMMHICVVQVDISNTAIPNKKMETTVIVIASRFQFLTRPENAIPSLPFIDFPPLVPAFTVGKMLVTIGMVTHILCCAWYGLGKYITAARQWFKNPNITHILYIHDIFI